ncbi:cyclic lactone autoinducer peptide [Enterocloster clostridioformis]
MRKEGNQVRRKLKSKFVSAVSKTLLAVAMLFAICPCAGKMYEPKLPEKLRKEIGG